LPSKIEEITCEKEGELKIKLEKERMQGIERTTENLKIKKLDRKNKNWRGGGTERERERRSEREGELEPRKWEREKKNKREGDLKKKI
jgi:hypothetical protein